MEQQAVEVEVVVPCVEGQEHPIRLCILSWDEWEVVYNPCEALLGRAFSLMAPCSHYVRENRNRLKREVLNQLAAAGAPAVPALIQALGDRDWDVRRAAAQALGQIGDAQAVPALRVHAERLAEAQQALQQLGAADFSLEQAVQTLARQAQWQVLMRALPAEAVLQAVVSLGTTAVPALIQALEDGEADVRRAAARALGQIGDAQAVPALIQALEDGEADVRRAAARALGQIGDARAMPALIQALEDGDWEVHFEAAEALVKIGAPAVPALCKALRDGNEWVRGEAARALGATRDARAVPALCKALRDRNLQVRPVAAWALGEIGNVQAVPALCKALRDRYWRVRCAAALALGKIGSMRAMSALEQALSDSYRDTRSGRYHVREAAQEALKKIRGW